MQVREATAGDLAAVIHVGVTTWRATYPPITGEAYVEDGIARWWTPEAVLPGIEARRVLVAEVDDQVVAMAAYSPLEDHLMLWKLYVIPEAQGSGAGRALLTEVIARAGDLPVRLTHLVGNDRAHAVYERFGFVDTGKISSPLDGGPEEVVMERPANRPRGAAGIMAVDDQCRE
ncbi:GNAT family N-acetyltransferase [Nocardioides panzhihuensis]|uniref:GNAT superfamily N-acetyltransferase n=1 Tax=Nocardioides panzhihuensis TaxID=860243 RepID=A0A7Z0DMZ6_9ACTN|nr:GNAT family N-acetyltransferase [Nocardioides panzhihuensis]NYI78192.1 GNAT superfamily N-acetyltransferase [Nocardioides panzhihuensis]